MSQPRPASILTHFAALDDTRQHAKVLYPLVEILLLALSATVAGADDFVETTIWSEENQAFLRCFFPYENGSPGQDTLCPGQGHESKFTDSDLSANVRDRRSSRPPPSGGA
jgi:hypothetical protein